VYYDNGVLIQDKTIQSSRLHELCKFYITLKWCIVKSALFACSTATNIGFFFSGGKILSWLKTPNCYLAGLSGAYAFFYMYPDDYKLFNGRKWVTKESTKQNESSESKSDKKDE